MAQKNLNLPPRDVIGNVMKGVVQIIALRQGMLGNMTSAWTGSGTIVHPAGVILTNCHVANPRAMGMPSPPADRLGIAITTRSDEPPALTYFAEIVAQSPELDLAVLRITRTIDGKSVRNLNLTHIPIGDSDQLDLGDTLSIFGYPGIGGETVTFTSGSVAGFSNQDGVRERRAWIKTDATIAGGNSGGTAVNQNGYLVGIPTQAAAGTGITPVDARPVVDTNRDGRIDQRDTPMAIGGFINGLRPVNLSKPYLEKAGLDISRIAPPPSSSSSSSSRGRSLPRKAPSGGPRIRPGAAQSRFPQRAPKTPPRTQPSTSKKVPTFSNLLFSNRVNRDGYPLNPTTHFPSGTRLLFATFEFDHMRNRTKWGVVWSVNGKPLADENLKWEDGPRGRKTIQIAGRGALPDGQYQVVFTVRGQVVAQGEAIIGRAVDDTDTEVSGRIVDQRTGRGISEALIIALKPNVSVRDFVRTQDKRMAFTSARTDRKGAFTFPDQLLKGNAYGLVVVARGYQDLVIESALRVGPTAPEKAEMSTISLTPER